MVSNKDMMCREFISNSINELKSYIPEDNYILNYCLIIWRNPLTDTLNKRFIISTADEVIDWKNKTKVEYETVEHYIYINGNLSY